MCNASRQAKHQRDAKAGEVLAIGKLHELGAFHTPGQAVLACVVCVQNGAELTLSNIPDAIQAMFNLKETEPVLFVDDNEGVDWSMNHDLFVFKAHPGIDPLPVAYFANMGVKAIAHTVAGTDAMVESIKALALRSQPAYDTPTLSHLLNTTGRRLELV